MSYFRQAVLIGFSLFSMAGLIWVLSNTVSAADILNTVPYTFGSVTYNDAFQSTNATYYFNESGSWPQLRSAGGAYFQNSYLKCAVNGSNCQTVSGTAFNAWNGQPSSILTTKDLYQWENSAEISVARNAPQNWFPATGLWEGKFQVLIDAFLEMTNSQGFQNALVGVISLFIGIYFAPKVWKKFDSL